MPTANEKLHYLELTRQTLRVVRLSGNKVEYLRECASDQKALVDEVLAEFAAGSPLRATVALTPLNSFWHVSSGDEASRHRGGEAVRAFLGGLPHGISGGLEFVHCQAEDGASLSTKGSARWLAGVAPAEAVLQEGVMLKDRGVEMLRAGSATLGRVGAVAAGLRWAGRGRALVWDLSGDRSQMFLVTSRGVDSVTTCPVGFESVFTAVQSALGLKFRGAASRLFYNKDYDFSEAGAKIGTDLASGLKSCVSGLLAGGPLELVCTGTLHHQGWLAKETAAALGLGVWQPDVAAWLKQAALNVEGELVVTPESLGILHLAASQGRDWHPAWMRAGMMDPKPAVAVASTNVAVSAIAERNGAAKSHMAVGAAATAVLKAEPVMASAVITRTEPAKTGGSNGNGRARPVDLTPPNRAGKTEVKTSGAVVKAGPGEPNRPSSVAVSPAAAPSPEKPAKSSRGFGLYIALGMAAAAAVVAGKFYLDAQESKRAAEIEKTQSALMAQTAQTRAQEIEQRAKEEAARLLKEAEAARESAVALARQQAQEQTRQEITAELEAERIATSPGILIVTTSPSGANVSINGATPRLTPLALNDLKPGSYTLEISLPGYDAVNLTAEIKGTQTTDLGMIPLARATGSLTISSVPEGVTFSMQKAGELFSAGARTGRTPVRFDDVMPGDYAITFSHAGWTDRTQTVSVTKQGSVEAAAEFKGGALEIVSSPQGAQVRRNGAVIGRTPLTLSELPPQDVRYELALDGYDPVVVSGTVAEGQRLRLESALLSVDRISPMTEIKTPPQAFETPAPELAGQFTSDKIQVSFVVTRDGSLREIVASGTDDKELAKRCVEAVSKWKFKPGLGHDDRPLNVRVSVPIQFATF